MPHLLYYSYDVNVSFRRKIYALRIEETHDGTGGRVFVDHYDLSDLTVA